MKQNTVVILVISGVALVGLYLWYQHSQAALAVQNQQTQLAAAQQAAALKAQQDAIRAAQSHDGSLGDIFNNLINSGTVSDIAGLF